VREVCRPKIFENKVLGKVLGTRRGKITRGLEKNFRTIFITLVLGLTLFG
jgi:hypothetical protein